MGETHVSNAQIYMVMGQVATKQKDYEKSLTVLADAWEMVESAYGKESEQVANVFLEIANVQAKKREINEAIDY